MSCAKNASSVPQWWHLGTVLGLDLQPPAQQSLKTAQIWKLFHLQTCWLPGLFPNFGTLSVTCVTKNPRLVTFIIFKCIFKMLHQHPCALLTFPAGHAGEQAWEDPSVRFHPGTPCPRRVLPICTVLLSWSSRKSATMYRSSLRTARRCSAHVLWKKEAGGPSTPVLSWSSSLDRRGLRRRCRSSSDGGTQCPFHRGVKPSTGKGSSACRGGRTVW